MHCCQERVGVGWEVHSRGGGFQLQDCADEGWVLVGEAIVFLTGPGTGFDVVDAADRFMPSSLTSLSRLVWAN